MLTVDELRDLHRVSGRLRDELADSMALGLDRHEELTPKAVKSVAFFVEACNEFEAMAELSLGLCEED
jgi:hypothetical protein